MNIPNAEKCLALALKSKWPALLIGSPGIGKTDLCGQVATQNNHKFTTEVATTLEPTDLKGLPSVVKGEADYRPYGFLRSLIEATEPTLVLIDDLGHAGPEVQKAIMHLILARSINDKKISDKVAFVAATNDIGQKAGVTGIISPLQNRFFQIKVEVDPKAWCDWAISNSVVSSVIGFVRTTPQLFSEWAPPVGIEATCTPRSMKMLSDFILAGGDDMQVFRGCIGDQIGLQFKAYLEMLKELPSVEKVLANPREVPIPTATETDKLYGICAALAFMEEESDWERIMVYLQRLPDEFQVLCVTDATTRHPKILKTKPLKQWIQTKKDVLL